MFMERSKQAMSQHMMKEIESSYAYLSMSAYCDSAGLAGFAGWLKAQSGEEWGHAMKFYGFLIDRGARVRFEALEAPRVEYSSPLEVFEAALENENAVTRAINDLYAMAEEEKDFASQAFLDWFVMEQVEEEKTVAGIVDWLKRIGDSDQGLYLLDRELGGGLEPSTEAATGQGGGAKK